MAPIQAPGRLSGTSPWHNPASRPWQCVCWVLAVAAVVVIGFTGSLRVGLVVVAGLVLIVAMPFVITVAGSTHPAIGEWLGRYTLPLAVGIPLLAIARGRPAYAERKIVIALASVVLALVICGQAAVFWHASTLFFTVPPDTPFVPTPGLRRTWTH